MPPKKKDNCPCCANVYNNTFRKELKCPYCPWTSCNMCCRQYILTKAVPQCMECKAVWTDDFLFTVFPKTWVDNDLRDHLDEVLIQQEKSLFPLAVAEIEKEQLEQKRRTLQYKRIQLENTLDRLNQKCIRLKAQISQYNRVYDTIEYDIKHAEQKQLEKEYQSLLEEETKLSEQLGKQIVTKFRRPCPNHECKGYIDLSGENLYCSICKNDFCGRCREKINKKEHTSHKCNEDTIKTLKLLDGDTKPCPSCKVPVFKIVGCFDGNTVIPLFSGGTKYAKDICIGDILIGDDECGRDVLNVCSGEDTMYVIHQTNGISYTVNSKHTLLFRHRLSYDIIEGHTDMLYQTDLSNYIGFTSDGIESDIRIECIGKGRYYGWKVNRNHRFVLSDKTVVKNCSQMFCTMCKTAFNWDTLEIETGRIHNPHYFEWLNENSGRTGQQQNREGNALIDPCGRPLHNVLGKLEEVIDSYYKPSKSKEYMPTSAFSEFMRSVIRLHNHINQAEMPTLREPTVRHLRDRVQYVANSITESVWKTRLSSAERLHKKQFMWKQILDTIYTVISDLIQGFLQTLSKIQFITCKQGDYKYVASIVMEIRQIKDYFNECSRKYSLRFNHSHYRYITQDLFFTDKLTVKEEVPETFEVKKIEELKEQEWMDPLEKEMVAVTRTLTSYVLECLKLVGISGMYECDNTNFRHFSSTSEKESFKTLLSQIYCQYSSFFMTLEDKMTIRARRKIRNKVLTTCLKLITHYYSELHTSIIRSVYPVTEIGETTIIGETHYLYPNYTFSVPCIYMPLLKGVLVSFKHSAESTTSSPIYDYNIYSTRITGTTAIFDNLYCTAKPINTAENSILFHLFELCLLGFLDSIHRQELEDFHYVKPLQQLYENIRLIRYSPFSNRKGIDPAIIREYQRIKEIIKGRITKKEVYCSGYLSKISSWLYI